MAQRLKVLDVFPEDLGEISSTYMAGRNFSNPRDPASASTLEEVGTWVNGASE